MTARAQIAPVGGDPAAEIDRPAEIEHPIALVTEPVNARLARQRSHAGRAVPAGGPHRAHLATAPRRTRLAIGTHHARLATGRRHLAHPTADRTSQRMRLALV